MFTVLISEFSEVDPLVLEAVAAGAWVAGGALRCVVDGTDLHDIDLFFPSLERAKEVEAYFLKRGAGEVFRCPAGELTTLKLNGIKIQFCQIGFYENIEALLDSFDFDCSRFAMDKEHVYFDDAAKHAAEYAKLTIHKLTYPAATLHRMQKYIRYGYSLPAETAKRFVMLLAENPELAQADRVYVD